MKILVVDDNGENRDMLEALLEGHGYIVEKANDGVQALAMAREASPDLVISDLLMPKMDGFALCREWKNDDRLRHIPFVVYTATYTDPKDEQFVINLGADRFMIKPADPDDFIQAIEEVVALKPKGDLEQPKASSLAGESYLRRHNEVLVRKLEAKIQALQTSNRDLKQEIEERHKAEALLRVLLDERETLLRELYHRTYNNMQMILSLLNLQAGAMEGETIEDFARCLENRIQAMALVQRMLHRSKHLNRVDLAEYIPALYQQLTGSYRVPAGKVRLEASIGSVELPIDSAIPLGLILNELIGNTLRHAFPGDRTGRITIRLSRLEDGRIELRYADDGIGLPAGFDLDKDAGIGLQTVMSLGQQQLKGTIAVARDSGLGFDLCFKVADVNQRD